MISPALRQVIQGEIDLDEATGYVPQTLEAILAGVQAALKLDATEETIAVEAELRALIDRFGGDKFAEAFTYQGEAKFTSTDSDYQQRSGEVVSILGPLTDGVDFAEVGPMYRIRFADGNETDAFADELNFV